MLIEHNAEDRGGEKEGKKRKKTKKGETRSRGGGKFNEE